MIYGYKKISQKSRKQTSKTKGYEVNMNNKNEFKNIRFNLTNKMQNDFIEILVIEQMIKEKNYKNDFELKLMIEYKNHLTKQYISAFRLNNKKQIKQYTDIMNK